MRVPAGYAPRKPLRVGSGEHTCAALCTVRAAPVPVGGLASSLLGAMRAWAIRLIRDPRDLAFLSLIAWATAVMIPFAGFLFVGFRWWLAAVYLAVNFFLFLDRFILMLHCTSHRPLFRSSLLNRYIPWVLGPLF